MTVPLIRLVASIALAAVAQPIGAQPAAAPSSSDASAVRHPYAAHVAEAARRFGIPERWIWAVMRVESNGDARALSTAGALGLMQIMPTTWARLRARYRLGSDPFDPRDNIIAGAAYLRAMHDRYGNVTAMLAAYNAGPSRCDDYLSRGRPLPVETRAYLAKLASITDAMDDTQLAAAPSSDPFAWRRAALFTAQPGALSATPPSADSMSSDMQTDDSVGLAMAAVPPPSSGLFVPLSLRRPQ